jgi:hypothetical protein
MVTQNNFAKFKLAEVDVSRQKGTSEEKGRRHHKANLRVNIYGE